MKSWFFISVAIILLGFSVVYLVVQDSNNNLEFAPGSVPICESTKSNFQLCTTTNSGTDRSVVRACVQWNATTNRAVVPLQFALLPPNGDCIDGWKIKEVIPGKPGYSLCEMAISMAKNGANPPPLCNRTACVDVNGVIGYKQSDEYRVNDIGGKPQFCCDIVQERTCTPSTSGTTPTGGEPKPSGTGGTTPPREPGSGKRDS